MLGKLTATAYPKRTVGPLVSMRIVKVYCVAGARRYSELIANLSTKRVDLNCRAIEVVKR